MLISPNNNPTCAWLNAYAASPTNISNPTHCDNQNSFTITVCPSSIPVCSVGGGTGGGSTTAGSVETTTVGSASTTTAASQTTTAGSGNNGGGNSVSTSNLGSGYYAGELMFSDTFEGSSINTANWGYDININGGGNGEFQIYNSSSDNCFIDSGSLFIQPTSVSTEFGEDFMTSGTINLANCNDPFGWGCVRTGSPAPGLPLPPVLSARITTNSKFYFTYGRLEIIAQLPAGDWIWPAMWLLPQPVNPAVSQNGAYGIWPQSGEIDLMESRGNLQLISNGVNIGATQFGSTLHFGVAGAYDAWASAHATSNDPTGQGYNVGFHNYTLLWTPQGFGFYIDGVEFGTVTPPAQGFFTSGYGFDPSQPNLWNVPGLTKNIQMAPFDQPFYIILNAAVGGSNGYFPDGIDPSKPWQNGDWNAWSEFEAAKSSWNPTWQDSSAMIIQSVKVFAL